MQVDAAKLAVHLATSLQDARSGRHDQQGLGQQPGCPTNDLILCCHATMSSCSSVLVSAIMCLKMASCPFLVQTSHKLASVPGTCHDRNIKGHGNTLSYFDTDAIVDDSLDILMADVSMIPDLGFEQSGFRAFMSAMLSSTTGDVGSDLLKSLIACDSVLQKARVGSLTHCSSVSISQF